MASRFKRSVPVTVNDVLDGHVALDLECLDRLYLHGYLGQLQVSGQVIQFLTHRGFKIYSAACLQQIGDGFRRRVASFAEANDIPVVTLKAADRNIEVMRPYLDEAAAGGRSRVAAIGVAQEMQRVFLARQRDTDPSKPAAVLLRQERPPCHCLLLLFVGRRLRGRLHQGLHVLPLADENLGQRPRMGHRVLITFIPAASAASSPSAANSRASAAFRSASFAVKVERPQRSEDVRP